MTSMTFVLYILVKAVKTPIPETVLSGPEYCQERGRAANKTYWLEFE